MSQLLSILCSSINKYCHDSDEFYLALSGGLDSVVLLELLVLAGFDDRLRAIYIDHQLQPDSKHWAEFTKFLCEKYNITYYSHSVSLKPSKSVSTEAIARQARYNVFSEYIDSKNKYLLTAHHLNDQAETFLIQLMRGSGPKGLSAMPIIKNFAGGYHLRPLLTISRESLHEYAIAKQLQWVEDQTNSDRKFDRNYIRHEIIPILKQRWPALNQTLANSARYCADYTAVLDEYLELDYQDCIGKDESISYYDMLTISKISHYSFDKMKLMIRYWLSQNSKLMPSEKILKEIIHACVKAREDSVPKIANNNYFVTKHRDYLCIVDKDEMDNSIEDNTVLSYSLGKDLVVDSLGIAINSRKVSNEVTDKKAHDFCILNLPDDAKINIKFRTKGQKCRPVNRGGSVSLKKLFQEHNVPVWRRSKIPILYIDGEIACVLGLTICEPYARQKSDFNWKIEYNNIRKG